MTRQPTDFMKEAQEAFERHPRISTPTENGINHDQLIGLLDNTIEDLEVELKEEG